MNIPFLVGIGFMMFSMYMLGYALRNFKNALHSQNWPVTKGRIVKLALWGSRNIDGGMKDVEHLKVAYEYKVQSKQYTSNAVAFYTLVYPETFEFTKNYPEGTDIKVYYNPTKPDESVLVPGPKSGNTRYSELILACMGVIIGIALAIAGWLGLLD